VSPTTAWAVGYANTDNYGGRAQALIERWNGSRWSIVPTSIRRVALQRVRIVA
jgi:hypothetical protein